jgi:hypothetical protein
MSCLKHLYSYREIPSQFEIMDYATSNSSYAKVKPGYLDVNVIGIAFTIAPSRLSVHTTNSERTPLSIRGATKL